jgi:hypothetical protein
MTDTDLNYLWCKFIRYLLAFCAVWAGLTVIVRGI